MPQLRNIDDLIYQAEEHVRRYPAESLHRSITANLITILQIPNQIQWMIDCRDGRAEAGTVPTAAQQLDRPDAQLKPREGSAATIQTASA